MTPITRITPLLDGEPDAVGGPATPRSVTVTAVVLMAAAHRFPLATHSSGRHGAVGPRLPTPGPSSRDRYGPGTSHTVPTVPSRRGRIEPSPRGALRRHAPELEAVLEGLIGEAHGGALEVANAQDGVRRVLDLMGFRPAAPPS